MDKNKETLLENMKDVFTLIHPNLVQKIVKPEVATANQERQARVQEWFNDMTEALLEREESPWGENFVITNPLNLLPRFLTLLRECILNHHWRQVLTMLNCISHIPYGADWTIWKATMATLYTEPKENLYHIRNFFKHTYLLKECHVIDMALEFVQYLLSQGLTNEALQVIQESNKKQLVILTSRGKHRKSEPGTRQAFSQEMLTLLEAYRGLIYYVDWKAALFKKSQLSESQLSQSFNGTVSSGGLDITIKSSTELATLYLDALIEKRGVWDIFITKSIEIHEFNGNLGEARSLLCKYRDKNPDNPNSHRFLYEFLTRNKAYLDQKSVDDEILSCLKSLAEADPANGVVLTLWQTLQDQGKYDEALYYIFDLMDHEQWQNDSKGWKCLSNSFSRGLSVDVNPENKKEFMKALRVCWSRREDWWPAYHFMARRLSSDSQSSLCQNLLVARAFVASILMGKDNDFSKKARDMMTDSSCEDLDQLLSNIER